MTTSRTEHPYQGTVRPGYSHQHPQHFHHNHQPLHFQERSLHPMHPLNPPTPNMHSQFINNNDTAMDSIQPLACLSAAAVAVATGAIVQNQPRDDHCHRVMEIDDDTESNRVRLPSIKMTEDSDGPGGQDNKERDGRSPQFTHQRVATSARYFGVSTEGASRAPGSTKTMIMTTQEPHDNELGSGQGGEDGSTRSAVVWDKAHGESNSRQQLPPVQTRQHHHPPSSTNVRASRDSSSSALNGSSSSLSSPRVH
ncbi:hypothetical protein EMPS_08492 [Entomortierella parvispora]|uniref:Uncharacterized protein n=1 Tax=Entomortierella parvispora TaxID=205924 RepID=A0A9P3LZF7_9FUNG|nr:hypothetical protein EMPS_08492 [Entomortierella parvispora]